MPISINRAGRYYFVRVQANNGQILMSGETLKTKASAKNQIISLCRTLKAYNPLQTEVIDNTKEPREIIYI
ncbi:MAG TPA: DUF1508 domain-containing protein [Flavitalea sp.]|nr:DUF1508 domain-containing protein [Flavitalea sp.]